jgi:hypothetical protein
MRDGEYWKEDLSHEVRRIRRVLQHAEVEGVMSQPAHVERFVLVTAFEMRKLTEAHALTEDVRTPQHRVVEYPCTLPPPHRTWFRVSQDGETWRQPVEQHYDLDAPKRSQLTFERLCDLLIHHFAFELRQRPGTGELEMLFTSDKTSAQLYGMTLDSYIAVVEGVQYDHIGWVDMDRAAGRVILRRQPPPDL